MGSLPWREGLRIGPIEKAADLNKAGGVITGASSAVVLQCLIGLYDLTGFSYSFRES